MLKADSVAAGKVALDAAEDAALGQCFDDGVASVPAGGGFTQADMDKAVADAKAADALLLAQAQSDAAAAMALVQAKLDDMSAKEQAEEAVVQGLQASASQLQAALDVIKALIFPPAPVA